MFGFHALESQFAIHKIESEFWEEILEKIYKKVITKHKPCLGLISNTFKEKVDDKIGSYSEITQFLFKKKIDPEKHDLLVLIDKDKFNAIFQEYLSYEEEDRSDFYHLKKKYEIGLEMLVYPLYNKLNKKALLMLDYPTERVLMDRICNELINIFSKTKP